MAYDDAAESDPGVRGGAHRAVLAGGVDGGVRTLGRRQVGRRPPRDGELGMAGGVAVGDPVAVFEQCPAVRVDQDRAERLVAVVEGRPREFDAAAETVEVVVADGHRREFTQPASR